LKPSALYGRLESPFARSAQATLSSSKKKLFSGSPFFSFKEQFFLTAAISFNNLSARLMKSMCFCRPALSAKRTASSYFYKI